MDRIEYRVGENAKDNRIGVSIKRPKEINRKWSERDIYIKCSECGRKELETNLTGDMVTITCFNCSNYWQGTVDKVLGYRKTEEAYARVNNIDNFEEVPRDERDTVL